MADVTKKKEKKKKKKKNQNHAKGTFASIEDPNFPEVAKFLQNDLCPRHR